MTRDELKAIIWRHLTREDIYDPAEVLDAILRAADEYGAGLAGGTARGIKAFEAFRDGQAIAAKRRRPHA